MHHERNQPSFNQYTRLGGTWSLLVKKEQNRPRFLGRLLGPGSPIKATSISCEAYLRIVKCKHRRRTQNTRDSESRVPNKTRLQVLGEDATSNGPHHDGKLGPAMQVGRRPWDAVVRSAQMHQGLKLATASEQKTLGGTTTESTLREDVDQTRSHQALPKSCLPVCELVGTSSRMWHVRHAWSW